MTAGTDDPSVTGRAPAAGPGLPAPADDSPYWSFYEQVASVQLAAWLPATPQRVLDLSGGRTRFAEQMVAAGHDVVHVRDDPRAPVPVPAGPGRLLPVVADPRGLSWLQEGSVEAVLAESRVLSLCLAADATVEDLRRALRPGGRLLLVVESLVLGLAQLACRGRWAELADVGAADVLLASHDDGSLTRCFWPGELQNLLSGAGFDVEWVRPRSVLSPATVERALAEGGPAALSTLVRTECRLAQEREGESTGLHLVVSARRAD